LISAVAARRQLVTHTLRNHSVGDRTMVDKALLRHAHRSRFNDEELRPGPRAKHYQPLSVKLQTVDDLVDHLALGAHR
jgi:hypothetical protein